MDTLFSTFFLQNTTLVAIHTDCCGTPVETNLGSLKLMDDEEFESYLKMVNELNFLSSGGESAGET